MSRSSDVRRRVGAVIVLAAGCTVPELHIEEQQSSATLLDAGSFEDASLDAEAAEPSTPDAGARRPVRSGKPPTTGAANGGIGGKGGSAAPRGGSPAAGSGGSNQVPAPAGAGGTGGIAGAPQNSAGSAAGEPASTQPPARACAAWVKVGARDNAPPAGAVEGGFETVTGVTNRQYVCRFRPAGSSFTIPGKYIVGLGCYVTYRRDAQQVDDASMLDGMFDVLTSAPGCTFSWRKASASDLPLGAVDLGDPAGGRNYACHGDYSTVASSGKQIGTLILSTDMPPRYQCFFESFSNAIQPTDPLQFEVLVQD